MHFQVVEITLDVALAPIAINIYSAESPFTIRKSDNFLFAIIFSFTTKYFFKKGFLYRDLSVPTLLDKFSKSLPNPCKLFL